MGACRETHPVPGDRRRAPRPGDLEPGRIAAAERSGAVGSRSAPRGSRCGAPSSWSATTASSPPARASAGSSSPSRCASASPTSARSRTSSRTVVATPSAGSSSSPSPPRPPTSPACSAPTRCCGSSAPRSPTASRSPSSPCGARASSAGRCPGRTSSSTPFYELLGVALRGATQTIGADAAEPDDAALLGVPVGAPILRCRRITTDTNGRPVLVSDHLYPAHRTEFVVELPLAEPSTTPAGLRLVEG